MSLRDLITRPRVWVACTITGHHWGDRVDVWRHCTRCGQACIDDDGQLP